jgi:hypothetical protein
MARDLQTSAARRRAMLGGLAVAVVAAGALCACERATPKVDVDPATAAQAKVFASKLIAAATASPAGGCDEDQLAALIDHDAIAAKVAEHSKLGGKRDAIAEVIARRHSGVKVLCAWLGVGASFKLLAINGTQPLIRKILREPGAKGSGVAYYGFELGRSRGDGVVRLIDAYSYVEGAWMSEILGQMVDATLAAGIGKAGDIRETMEQIKKLRAERKGAEALALVDRLPATIRDLRYIQMMRAGIARQVSEPEYLRALDDLGRRFPNDPAVAMMEIDGAILHGDQDRALALIDVVDKSVGGDPFQDAIRSAVYLQKHDLEHAAARAQAAIAAEPKLARAWFAKLDVELARKDWPAALAAIDRLAKLGTKLTDAGMAKVHAFDDLRASPEYAAWLGAPAAP